MSQTSKTITAAIIQRETLKRIGPRLEALPEFSLPTDAEGVFGILLKKLDVVAAGSPIARTTKSAAEVTCGRSEAT